MASSLQQPPGMMAPAPAGRYPEIMGRGRIVESRSPVAAFLLALGLGASGCGALLDVDHDWEQVEGGDDFSDRVDAPAADSAPQDGTVIEAGGGDSGTPASDATSPDAAVPDAASESACALGTLDCDDAQPELCTGSGTWQPVGAACSGAKPACLAGACADCTPGTLGCNGQQPEQCDSTGTWQNEGGACSGQACVDGACTGVCAPGALECVDTYWWVCNGNGGWQLVGTQC